jgi:hypothetical protein
MSFLPILHADASPDSGGPPWELWVYLAIGLLVAYWYQSREGHPEREHPHPAQRLVLLILAWMWPVLLLAMLVNRPDKIRPKPAKDKNRNNASGPSSSANSDN